jgi:hypothetical protein
LGTLKDGLYELELQHVVHSESQNLQWAIAVLIAYKVGGRIVKIIHIGSTHNKEELDILVAITRKRLFFNQLEFRELKKK